VIHDTAQDAAVTFEPRHAALVEGHAVRAVEHAAAVQVLDAGKFRNPVHDAGGDEQGPGHELLARQRDHEAVCVRA